MKPAAAALAAAALAAVLLARGTDAGASTVCVSSGDTHMYPFGGQGRFDIYSPRPFEMATLQSSDHDRRFQVEIIQKYGIWGGNTVDNDLAVRCGRDLVVFRQHRDGSIPRMTVNGRPHSVGSGGRFYLPSPPSNSRSRYFVSASHNHWWHTFEIHCNLRGYESGYAFGHKVAVQWYRPYQHWWYRQIGANRVVYANVQIETQSRYAWQFEKGACGWWKNRAEPRNHNHLIEYRTSLFAKTAADHAKEAKAGAKVSDPGRLKAAAAKCAAAIHKATGVTLAKAIKWFGGEDKAVAKAVAGFIRGCSIDTYYGLGHNTMAMAKSVCEWVSLASDSVYQDSVRLIASIRSCKKPYVSPKKLIPLLEEKFRLAQFCTSKRPAKRDPLPGGTGFSPTCEATEAAREKLRRASDEAKAKAKALADELDGQQKQAAAEAVAKKVEGGKLEEEQKKIEKEKQETAELEAKAREDLQKRAAAKAEGAKAPFEKVSGPEPGTTMAQASKVLVMDNTANGGASASSSGDEAAASSSEEESSEDAGNTEVAAESDSGTSEQADGQNGGDAPDNVGEESSEESSQ